MRPRSTLFVPFCLAAVLLISSGRPTQAAKFVQVDIQQDGKRVLENGWGVDDYADAGEIWASLLGAHLKAMQEIPSDPDDSQRATLTGDIRIAFVWARDPMVSVRVDRLRLERVPGTKDLWQLPREEVERTAQVGGLQLRKPLSLTGPLLAGAVCVLFGVVAAVFVWYMRRLTNSPPKE